MKYLNMATGAGGGKQRPPEEAVPKKKYKEPAKKK